MTKNPISIVVHGISTIDEIPEFGTIANSIPICCAPTLKALREALPGSTILLGWNYRASELREAWDTVDNLRWIHWAGAGVDAVLFPKLIKSNIVLTNMRGIFDRAIAEYVLGLVLAFAKDLPGTLNAQRELRWAHRLSECIVGGEVLIVGVGGIGRAIGRILGSVGCTVRGVGRSARAGGSDFSSISGREDLNQLLRNADYVVVAAPLTKETRGLFSDTQFSSMKPTARLINIGRGLLIDENALVSALQKKLIAGAALDVFQTEPLPVNSPLWKMPNVIVSPHMSGDYKEHKSAMARLFLENLHRYTNNAPLINIVDKTLGFVPS